MLAILVAASPEDRAFADSFSGYLRPHFSIVDTIGKTLQTDRSKPPIVICGMESFGQIDCEKIIIARKQAKPFDKKILGEGKAVAVVDSSDAGLLEHFSQTKIPAITCGLNRRDTISLSSMSESQAVLDIRRGITCFDGTVIEPQEIPVRMKAPAYCFSLMAAASVIILSGKIDILIKGKM